LSAKKEADVKLINIMTKKAILKAFSVVFLLSLCISFYSCEKEGVFNPTKKISKIYADFETFIAVFDPETEEYSYKNVLYPKQLTQDWVWDKNKLSKIDFWTYYFIWWEEEISEGRIWGTDNYFYEKNRLIRIEQDGEYFIKILYDGSQYKKMEFYNDHSEIWLTMDFIYNKNKISHVKVEVNWNNWKKEAEIKLLSSFLPKEVVSKLMKKPEKKKSKKNIDLEEHNIYYTYTGDNIDKMIYEYIDDDGDRYQLTAQYLSYDSKQNPFYKKGGFEIEGEFMFGVTVVSSKNNPLQVNYEIYEEYYGTPYTDYFTSKYKYTYNKNYPIEVLSETIWDDGDIETRKLYYEYR
jgi:hypothetical protein